MLRAICGGPYAERNAALSAQLAAAESTRLETDDYIARLMAGPRTISLYSPGISSSYASWSGGHMEIWICLSMGDGIFTQRS